MGQFADWKKRRLDEIGLVPEPDSEMEDEPLDAPPSPEEEPFSQARRKAIQAAQKFKPTARQGMSMAQDIRGLGSQERGYVNQIHQYVKSADLPQLRRILTAIERIMPVQPYGSDMIGVG